MSDIDNDKPIAPSEYTLDREIYDNVLSDRGKLYRKIMGVDPDSLDGQVQPFYGAHSNCFKFGSIIFEVLEDPDDGYRSAMDIMLIHPDQNMSGFFDMPLSNVKLEIVSDGVSVEYANKIADFPPLSETCDPSEYDKYNGWRLVDIVDGHVWLEFGTRNCDDYYPFFWFYYQPKQQQII